MKVLVACEFSQIVTKAFRDKGHEAISCDILPTEGNPDWHIQGDVLDILACSCEWDLMIAHPPCTYLTCAGNKWFKPEYMNRWPDRHERRDKAASFFIELAKADIPKICIENPIGVMSTLWQRPNQIIQPYQFGHDCRKATCLWLKNLPQLKPTNIIKPTIVTTSGGNTMSAWHVKCGHLNRKDRGKLRSITFQGIANAMAEQWG